MVRLGPIIGTSTWHPNIRRCARFGVVPYATLCGELELKANGRYLSNAVACRIAWPQAVDGKFVCISSGLAMDCRRLIKDSAMPF